MQSEITGGPLRSFSGKNAYTTGGNFYGFDAGFYDDLRGLTHTITQIIQLGAADFTVAHNLYLLDGRRGQGEYLLHADAVRDTAQSNKRGKNVFFVEDQEQAVQRLSGGAL